MSDKRKTDRRVLRTRSSLQSALKQLMQEKQYSKIKVSEIVEVANVARPTFYMHFQTKDDLLISLFNDVFDEFKVILNAELGQGNYDLANITGKLFEYWDGHSKTFKIFLEAGIDLIVLNQFQQCISGSITKLRSEAKIDYGQFTPYVDDCIASCLYMVLKRWIQDDKRIDPKELGQFFGQMASLTNGATINKLEES
ncbi:MAG: TetR/AcrR family transcriptional regulator [Anaerolineae bacterium]